MAVRIEREQSEEANEIGIGTGGQFVAEDRHDADAGQDQDQALAPNRAFGGVIEDESGEVKIPGMDVRRRAFDAMSPGQISAQWNRADRRGWRKKRKTGKRQTINQIAAAATRWTGLNFNGTGMALASMRRRQNSFRNSAAAAATRAKMKVSLVACIRPMAAPASNAQKNLFCLRVSPAGSERQQSEEDQQHFVDVIAAIENHRGRNREQQPGTKCGARAEAIRKQRQQQNQADAEQDVTVRNAASSNCTKSRGAPVSFAQARVK